MEKASRTFALLTFVSLVFIFIMLTSLELEYTRQTQLHPRRTQLEAHDNDGEGEGGQDEEEEEEEEEYASEENEDEDDDNNDSVCRDVFEIRKTSPNMTEWMTNAVKVIRAKKRKRRFIPSLFYEVVGQESPAMTARVNDSSGHLGSNLTVAKEWRLDLAGGYLPHLSCHLRKFDAPEVDRCVRARGRAGKTTKVTYVGDSRIRLHVELLIDLLRDLRPKITTYKGEEITVEDFLGEKGQSQWMKYKNNFRVDMEGAGEGEEARNGSGGGGEEGGSRLAINFLWAALIELSEVPPKDKGQENYVGAMEFLESVSHAPQEDLPDLLILNTGAWQLATPTLDSMLEKLDKAAVGVMVKLRRVLERLAARTAVVWALPDPLKEYISHDYSGNGHFTHQTNRMLEWLSNAQTSLQPPGVIVWDSFLPVAHRAAGDCVNLILEKVDLNTLPHYSVFPPPNTWNCWERMHIGLEALSVAVQMMLNHVCNPYLPPTGHCCSGGGGGAGEGQGGIKGS
ncbi:uncharacterized protein LOC127006835 [Eriocheir sinensis]|uniref:uncharacterized protein LOC127006835 n=1 Tax=Eriocheir sinensis TaxID=95602 RepID=UPI0021C7B71C|nr:uncharacterized protein LOC127006835 [Eriocheir sinensis]